VGLVVLGTPRAGADLDRRDLDLLEAIAHQAAAVLDNLRLLDLATTDPLTRLPRRQVFEERLRQELDRSARTGRPLAVALADVDDFKRLNDGHGHLAGDRALQAVAGTLAGGCRSTDLVARFGGEEFVLLFPETGLDAAAALAEKLRAGVAAREVTGLDGERLSVTVSLGLAAAEGPGGGVGPADLLRAADEALYRAKAGGKNRVEAAGGRAA
jgi:diguanylate cyclase (GGDEF)-like protein